MMVVMTMVVAVRRNAEHAIDAANRTSNSAADDSTDRSGLTVAGGRAT